MLWAVQTDPTRKSPISFHWSLNLSRRNHSLNGLLFSWHKVVISPCLIYPALPGVTRPVHQTNSLIHHLSASLNNSYSSISHNCRVDPVGSYRLGALNTISMWITDNGRGSTVLSICQSVSLSICLFAITPSWIECLKMSSDYSMTAKNVHPQNFWGRDSKDIPDLHLFLKLLKIFCMIVVSLWMLVWPHETKWLALVSVQDMINNPVSEWN